MTLIKYVIQPKSGPLVLVDPCALHVLHNPLLRHCFNVMCRRRVIKISVPNYGGLIFFVQVVEPEKMLDLEKYCVSGLNMLIN